MPHTAKPPVRRLETESGSFAYAEAGEGEPVLFVHGSLGTLHDFSRQLSPFSARYRFISYSRRFHPPSPPPQEGETYTIDGHADDCSTVIARLQAAPVHLVGASWGGYVGLALALRSPELVASLVLMEPPILPLLQRSTAGRIAAETFTRDAIEPSRAAFLGGEPEEGVRRFVDGIAGVAGSFDALPQKAKERLLGAAAELKLEFCTPHESYMPPPDPDRLAELKIPVLLVQGERSPKLFHLILDELELALPDTRRVIIPRSGHAVQIENPQHFNGVLEQFLEEVRRP